MRRVPSKHRNKSLPRQKERGALGRLASLLICGLVLATGFVYAGVQHFGALRIGYQIQKLRTDLERAEEDQKRLSVQREAAVSPIRLEQAARRLGMQPMRPAQLDPLAQRAEASKVFSTAPRIEAMQARQPARADSGTVSLKSTKTTSSQGSKQASASTSRPAANQVQGKQKSTVVSLRPALTKGQEKPKPAKAAADQKKSR